MKIHEIRYSLSDAIYENCFYSTCVISSSSNLKDAKTKLTEQNFIGVSIKELTLYAIQTGLDPTKIHFVSLLVHL